MNKLDPAVVDKWVAAIDNELTEFATIIESKETKVKPLSKPLQDRMDGINSVMPFYVAYVKLCAEHDAHMDINYYGADIVVKDGIDYPIASILEAK